LEEEEKNYDKVEVLWNGKLHLIITTQSLDKAEQLHTSEREKISLFICRNGFGPSTFYGHMFILCSLSVWRW
jgi:hypothetical protein